MVVIYGHIFNISKKPSGLLIRRFEQELNISATFVENPKSTRPTRKVSKISSKVYLDGLIKKEKNFLGVQCLVDVCQKDTAAPCMKLDHFLYAHALDSIQRFLV